MRKKPITDVDETVSVVLQELATLALLDGGGEGEGKVNFFTLKKFLKCLRRSEDWHANKHLDSVNDSGIIPSRDISKMMKK